MTEALPDDMGYDRLSLLPEEVDIWTYLDGTALARVERCCPELRRRCAGAWAAAFRMRYGVAGGRGTLLRMARETRGAPGGGGAAVSWDKVLDVRGGARSLAGASACASGTGAVAYVGEVLIFADVGARTSHCVPCPFPRRRNADIAVLGGATVVHSGGVDGGRAADSWVLDGRGWSRAAAARGMLPTVHHSVDAVRGANGGRGALVLFGGQHFDGEPCYQCFALRCGDGDDGYAWAAVCDANGPRPPARARHLSCAMDETLVVAGGLRTLAPGTFDDAWVLDTVPWVWTKVSLGAPVAAPAAARPRTFTWGHGSGRCKGGAPLSLSNSTRDEFALWGAKLVRHGHKLRLVGGSGVAQFSLELQPAGEAATGDGGALRRPRAASWPAAPAAPRPRSAGPRRRFVPVVTAARTLAAAPNGAADDVLDAAFSAVGEDVVLCFGGAPERETNWYEAPPHDADADAQWLDATATTPRWVKVRPAANFDAVLPFAASDALLCFGTAAARGGGLELWRLGLAAD
ncbi:hypothetical protein M885DRAFT_526241 [Pelagophyceae sp. CCMP2097]|nr:hypothetical protein M885DRAFT_526241 [Pelagophyceae sp. CCMP2097]